MVDKDIAEETEEDQAIEMSGSSDRNLNSGITDWLKVEVDGSYNLDRTKILYNLSTNRAKVEQILVH